MSLDLKEYPEIYIYIGESIDGKGSGEMLYISENRPVIRYYFKNEYSFDCKSILMGRTTFEEVLNSEKNINLLGSSKIHFHILKQEPLQEVSSKS